MAAISLGTITISATKKGGKPDRVAKPLSPWLISFVNKETIFQNLPEILSQHGYQSLFGSKKDWKRNDMS